MHCDATACTALTRRSTNNGAATIAEGLHAQLHRMHAGFGQASVGVVGRSVCEGQVTLQAMTRRHPGEDGVTAATDTHRSLTRYAVRSQLTTPSGDSTEVPNRPSQRARIRFLAKSSVLNVSDHCTPTPMVSVSTTTASTASTWPTPAASAAQTGAIAPDACCAEAPARPDAHGFGPLASPFLAPGSRRAAPRPRESQLEMSAIANCLDHFSNR